MADLVQTIRNEINKRIGSAINIIRRGVLTLASDSYFAQWEANDGELYDESEFWQTFGFASRPPAGGEILFANLGGHGEHAIGFATNDRAHRPSGLAYGDSVHYASTSGGLQPKAHAKASGNYEISAGTNGSVTATANGTGGVTLTAGASANVSISSGASGHVNLTPGTGTVNVGGDSTACTDYMIMGTTFDTALRAALGTKSSTPKKVIAEIVVAAGDLYGAFPVASTALSNVADLLQTFVEGSYLATKGKVK